LARADGTNFKLSDLRGKVVLLFFGYTSCPDVCPITMGQLKQAVDELGDEANQVEVLFVTVDPNRDTPQRVQEYVNHFSPSFIGLSGSDADLTKVWNDFGIFREMPGDTSGNYEVGHTARITVIDQRGNMRLSYPFDTPAENIVHDLKLLLK
jgi:protein SCO1/2